MPGNLFVWAVNDVDAALRQALKCRVTKPTAQGEDLTDTFLM
jgi:hypothetical protein